MRRALESSWREHEIRSGGIHIGIVSPPIDDPWIKGRVDPDTRTSDEAQSVLSCSSAEGYEKNARTLQNCRRRRDGLCSSVIVRAG